MSTLRLSGIKNTFEWQIHDFWRKTKYHDSPDFEIDGRRFYLIAEHLSSNYFAGKFWGIWLNPKDPSDSSSPISYTMSVVDQEGQDFLTRNGTVEGALWDQPLLGFLTETYLKQNNLTESDTLTVRFTFELKVDGPLLTRD